MKTYNKLKEATKNFEIIFVSSDRDEDSMMEYLGEMPWLAIPFDDPRKKTLARLFDVSGIYNIGGECVQRGGEGEERRRGCVEERGEGGEGVIHIAVWRPSIFCMWLTNMCPKLAISSLPSFSLSPPPLFPLPPPLPFLPPFPPSPFPSFFSLSPILHPAFLPGIPTLILLDEEGNVITTQGRGAVTSDPDGKVSHAHDVVSSEPKVRHIS